MKRVLIAMLLVLALLSTGIASGSYVQAKTQKYWVYDSAQAKVKGNKLVVKAPLYVGEKKIKKKKVFILTNKTKYWDPNLWRFRSDDRKMAFKSGIQGFVESSSWIGH